MELTYSNKKSEYEILDRAYSNGGEIEYSQSSKLIKSENFIALSMLLKNYSKKFDLIYIDPPFNTKNDFFYSQLKANSISSAKNSQLAYSDKMSKDEFLEFIRERLVILRELLSDEGSIYLHIDYKVGHYIKLLMDEIFGEENFKNDITRIKSNPKNFYRRAYGNEKDLILFYVKDPKKNIWNDIKIPLTETEIEKRYPKIDDNGRRYTTIPLHAPGETKSGVTGMPWHNINVPEGRHWRTDPSEFDKLNAEGFIEWSSNGNPRIKKFADENKGKKIQDIWKFKDPQVPVYPTQKNADLLKQIIEQSSNESSMVLDCFSGSGTTLAMAELLGRKWIGIDNSSVAIEVSKSRLSGSKYEYIEL